ncbi:MAG: motility associated factor glycosyltransferase family protein [Cellulosilyticaceae bacterium]
MGSIQDAISMGVEKAKKEEEYTCYFEMRGKKKYIWSKYEPVKVAKQLINLEGTNKETIWILLGIGLGHAAREIINQVSKNSRIILVEPSDELVECQKDYIEDLIQNESIKVATNKTALGRTLKEVIRNIDLKNIKVIMQPVYREFYNQYYLEVLTDIQEYVDKLQVNINTITSFSEINLKNLINNKEAIKNSKSLSLYHKHFENIPAVIVSAGPSLKKNIQYLKDFKGLIFTGGRTLPHVMKQGIQPHFLVSIDPTEISYETLQEGKQNQCNLICTEVTNHHIINENRGNQYFIRGTQEKLAQSLLGIELMSLPMYGSVATACLSSAYYMGCNPIIFIGQDLAYTDQQAHVDGFKSFEVDMHSAHIRYVEGIDGQQIATDITLLLFLRWIEQFIKDTKNQVNYINCTEGGAHIQGTQVSRFKDTIEQYQDNYKIEFLHKEAYRKEERDQIDYTLEQTLKNLYTTRKIAQKGIALSERLEKEYTLYNGKNTGEIDRILSKLTKEVDHKLKQSNGLGVEIFTREYIRIGSQLEYKEPLQEDNKQRELRIVKMSHCLYQNIYDATHQTLQIIESQMK